MVRRKDGVTETVVMWEVVLCGRERGGLVEVVVGSSFQWEGPSGDSRRDTGDGIQRYRNYRKKIL